jgi:hypothetical protein
MRYLNFSPWSLALLSLTFFSLPSAYAGSLQPLPLSSTKKQQIQQNIRPRSLALVVGIQRFRSPRWMPLHFPLHDVKKMSRLFQFAKFDDIERKITPESTTKSSLIRSLQKLGQKTKHSLDTVVVYISSHGTAVNSSRGIERYIITSDTTANVSATALSIRRILSILQKYRSRRILLILAACYTGHPQSKSQLPPGQKGLISPPLLSSPTPAIQILNASGQGQAAYEHKKLRSDVYTHYLVKCIKEEHGRSPSGTVAATDAHRCASVQTHKFVKKHLGAVQFPGITSIKNREIPIIHGQKSKNPRGYLGTAWQHIKRVVVRPSKAKGKESSSQEIQITPHEWIALKPGRYEVTAIDHYGVAIQQRVIEIQPDAVVFVHYPLQFTAQGGMWGSSLGGSDYLLGGSLGLRYRYIGLSIGGWTTSSSYASSLLSYQLLLELRAEAGYQNRWGWFEFFAGGYTTLALLLQDITAQTKMGSVLRYGVTLFPCFWVAPRWGLTLQIDGGFSLHQLARQWRHVPELSVRLGLQIPL